ncbi:similar to Saccharomyces cerevisiae YJR096W Putative xylose and arabinose reductase [Maudiozyma saulgeensis]|uniref:Similar to Saccharomyces cerevisiae YJR096W Putative xylose and arabinose reductase n=1 Tax=Maudiozyma saulgeensis TaxID=1789683 RepID=A0A1X7R6E9_9SACH|nr:similar to Saccharomyces cerevisiae YJR096W Putative xylose and arabinose reductase [Kazachstania saulgeensis]
MQIPKEYTLSTGYTIPSVALGCYNIPKETTTELVEAALERGYRHFDTAVLYENEKEVGDGIANWLLKNPDHSRDEIFYTTKLWNSQFGYENTKKAILDCLRAVNSLGYIDLLLMHSPIGGKTIRLETWRAMQEAVDSGIVKNIGVSNFGKQHIADLLSWLDLKYPPVVNQIEISPWCMRQELADYCKQNGIFVEAYAPLTHGYKINDLGLLRTSKETGKNPAQILIRWSLQHGYIPLPKTETVSRLSGNLDVYDFELTDEQMVEIDHPEAYEPTDWECTTAP